MKRKDLYALLMMSPLWIKLAVTVVGLEQSDDFKGGVIITFLMAAAIVTVFTFAASLLWGLLTKKDDGR